MKTWRLELASGKFYTNEKSIQYVEPNSFKEGDTVVLLVGKGRISFMLNEIDLGLAVKDKTIEGKSIVPRISLGNEGDVIKLMEGFSQEIKSLL